MATLTGDQLAQIRHDMASGGSVNWTKGGLNAAVQAIENIFESSARAALSTAIDTATAPTVLTNPQKKRLIAAWLKVKFVVEGG